jgi:hypothetical protein
MPINHNHYNLQESRSYPLGDSATGVGDSGEYLPPDLLVDCQLRFPATAGRFAFIGGITVNPRMLTLVILAADSPTAVSGFTPLASLNIMQPGLTAGRHYAVTPLYPGVGGWLVFGPGIAKRFVGRFSSPQQSLLAIHCAKSYRGIPVSSLGKAGMATALTGLVTISGGTDIEAVKETVEIGGESRDALVLRLKASISGDNVLAKYLPVCGGRPESRTCPETGIEYINGVQPDCDGNLTITFGNLTSAPYSECGGVAIEHDRGFDDACGERVPFVEYQDPCVAEESSATPDPTSSASSESSLSASSEILNCEALPYTLNFDDPPEPDLEIKNGTFEYEAVDSPDELNGSLSLSDSSQFPMSGALTATSGSTRNIAIWDNCGASPALDKTIIADVQVLGSYPSRNGGIILNYHLATPLTTPHIEFFMVLLDLNVNKIRVVRYNGTTFVDEYASPSPLLFAAGDWYRITATVTTFSPTQKAIAVTVVGISDPGFGPISFSLATTRYGDPTDGRFGFGSIRGYARCSFLQLEEFP